MDFEFMKMPKRTRNAIDMADEQTAAMLLHQGEDNTFVTMYDILCDLMMTDYKMNDDQLAFITYPLKVWGKMAGYELYKMKKEKWDKSKH